MMGAGVNMSTHSEIHTYQTDKTRQLATKTESSTQIATAEPAGDKTQERLTGRGQHEVSLISGCNSQSEHFLIVFFALALTFESADLIP